ASTAPGRSSEETTRSIHSPSHLLSANPRSGFEMVRIVSVTAAVSLVVLLLVWPHPVSSHETLTTTVLFDREIVQVLNRHCVMCHFEKGPSFPLETYEQTWLRGRQIRASVIARHMPLWPAVSGYG